MGGMKDLFGDIPYESRSAHQITRTGNPSTSYEAGERILPKMRELQKLVYGCFVRNPGGLTDYDLEEKCGSHGSTYRTRRSELVDMGLIRDSGRKRLQKGRNRVVWELVP